MTPIQLVGGYLMAMLVRNRRRGVGLFRTIYCARVVGPGGGLRRLRNDEAQMGIVNTCSGAWV